MKFKLSSSQLFSFKDQNNLKVNKHDTRDISRMSNLNMLCESQGLPDKYTVHTPRSEDYYPNELNHQFREPIRSRNATEQLVQIKSSSKHLNSSQKSHVDSLKP